MDSPPPMVSSLPPMDLPASANLILLVFLVGLGLVLLCFVPGLTNRDCTCTDAAEQFHNITPPPPPPPPPPAEHIQLVEIVIDKCSKGGSSEEVKCPICLDGYEDGQERATVAPCNHRFHADCIKQWRKLNSTCPVCRLDMVQLILSS